MTYNGLNTRYDLQNSSGLLIVYTIQLVCLVFFTLHDLSPTKGHTLQDPFIGSGQRMHLQYNINAAAYHELQALL